MREDIFETSSQIPGDERREPGDFGGASDRSPTGVNPEVRIVFALVGIVVTLLVGTLGFHFFGSKPRSLADAFWLALITITTVGYGDDVPRSTAARFVTVMILGSGFLFVSLATASFVELLVEGRINRLLGRRSVEQRIAGLKKHYIVCGYGRMGRLICREIVKRVPVVVIERREEALRKLEEDGIPFIIGDATEEEVLEKAGIERASGLVSVVASDAENVFIVLTAREMNRALYLLARAVDERSERKLLRAGASKVISPYLIGGLRLAQAILKPAVVDFLEFILHNDSLDVQVEEALVQEASFYANKPLSRSEITNQNVIVMAIKRSNGRMAFNPSRETIINPGDTLIVMGPEPGLKKIQELAGAA